jgi:hypothetical protein
MFLHDAYDDIMTRKAEEAPGGIAPLNPSWTSPDYDPVKVAEWAALPQPAPSPLPPQITITGKRIAPVPSPIQIPLLNLVPTQPGVNPWDSITARRAAMVPATTSGGLASYLPWLLGAAAAAAALLALTSKKTRRPTAARRTVSRPRLSYARQVRR